MGCGTNGQKVYQTSPFSWPIWMRTQLFPGLLIISCTISVLHPSRSSPSSPSYKQAMQQKYLPAPNCFICKYPEGLPAGLHCTGTLLTYSQLLAHQDPRLFLLSCFLVSLTQQAHGVILFQEQDFAHALIPFSLSFNSNQFRISVAITTCHKPHCNGAKMHPAFALVVPTWRSLSANKRPITR